MGIRDRGKIKWQGAFFMPEHVGMLKSMTKDYHRQEKPILDEYHIDEFESKIHLAMEFTYLVKVTTWENGFEKDYKGLVNRLDPLTKKIYLELNSEEAYIKQVKFEDIVRIQVVE